MIYRQLALLLESGVNIATALELLQDQISNRTLKKVIAEVTADIRAGNQLTTAMSRHPEIFSTFKHPYFEHRRTDRRPGNHAAPGGGL